MYSASSESMLSIAYTVLVQTTAEKIQKETERERATNDWSKV